MTSNLGNTVARRLRTKKPCSVARFGGGPRAEDAKNHRFGQDGRVNVSERFASERRAWFMSGVITRRVFCLGTASAALLL